MTVLGSGAEGVVAALGVTSELGLVGELADVADDEAAGKDEAAGAAVVVVVAVVAFAGGEPVPPAVLPRVVEVWEGMGRPPSRSPRYDIIE